MMLRNSLMIILLLITNHSFGYLYFLSIKKGTNKNGSAQLIILLADYHDKTHPANKGQRVYLESLLQRCNREKIKLIVEDLSSVNNDGRMICGNFGINCTEGVLSTLASKMRSLGITVDNVEYRYCRVAAIGPLINNSRANPHSFRSCSGITMAALHKEITDEIEKIKKYNDGKQLNDYYKRAIKHVTSHLSKMNVNSSDRSKTVAHYCACLRSSAYRKKLENVCIFDSTLIDSNIMHSIMCCDKPIIFVAAGGSHILEIDRLLEKMRYESLYAVPDNNQKPIDITVLEKFIE